MAADNQNVLELTIDSPKTLADITKWAAIAELIGIPTSSPVVLTVSHELRVRAYLAQVPFPESEED